MELETLPLTIYMHYLTFTFHEPDCQIEYITKTSGPKRGKLSTFTASANGPHGCTSRCPTQEWVPPTVRGTGRQLLPPAPECLSLPTTAVPRPSAALAAPQLIRPLCSHLKKYLQKHLRAGLWSLVCSLTSAATASSRLCEPDRFVYWIPQNAFELIRSSPTFTLIGRIHYVLFKQLARSSRGNDDSFLKEIAIG